MSYYHQKGWHNLDKFLDEPITNISSIKKALKKEKVIEILGKIRQNVYGHYMSSIS